MRLLLTILATFFVGFLLLFVLRVSGYATHEKARLNSFLQQGFTPIYKVRETAQLPQKNQNAILDLIVQENDKKEFVVLFADSQPLLEKILTQYSEARFLFRLQDGDPDAHIEFMKFVYAHDLSERLVFHSESANILKDVRDKYPQILTTVSHAELTLMLFMHHLWIETIFPIHGDIVLLQPTIQGNSSLLPRLLEEFHRRKKITLLDLDVSSSDTDICSPEIDGWSSIRHLQKNEICAL